MMRESFYLPYRVLTLQTIPLRAAIAIMAALMLIGCAGMEEVILEDFGLTVTFWNSQPEASAHLITTFFNTGEVDASLYTYQPLGFNVGLGRPRLVKMVLGIVLVVFVIVVAVAWFIVRRVRRRRTAR